MMTLTRKRYDRQFRTAAVQVVISREKSVRELARGAGDQGFHAPTAGLTSMSRWVLPRSPATVQRRSTRTTRIVKLRKRVEELEKEHELLKRFRAFLQSDHA